jgi:hypothetical protein
MGNRGLHLPPFRHDFDATRRKSDRPASGFFAIVLPARDSRGTIFVRDRAGFRGRIVPMDTSKGSNVMTRPVREALESYKAPQPGQRRDNAALREHAYVTFLMASALSLATLIAVATVSMDVVTAAALR